MQVFLDWLQQQDHEAPIEEVECANTGQGDQSPPFFHPHTSCRTRSAFSPRILRICSSEYPRFTSPLVMFGRSLTSSNPTNRWVTSRRSFSRNPRPVFRGDNRSLNISSGACSGQS